ncbi:MAG: hypothetical protein CFE41_04065 [Burkholderiales bacterium PBB2]|nr:MAG: hypothetical protein CFE41_04065 [Burkholderiales bacterium PBB2]
MKNHWTMLLVLGLALGLQAQAHEPAGVEARKLYELSLETNVGGRQEFIKTQLTESVPSRLEVTAAAGSGLKGYKVESLLVRKQAAGNKGPSHLLQVQIYQQNGSGWQLLYEPKLAVDLDLPSSLNLSDADQKQFLRLAVRPANAPVAPGLAP